MKTTIELPDEYLQFMPFTMRYGCPKKGDKFITFSGKPWVAAFDYSDNKHLIIVPTFDPIKWATKNLSTPKAQCWVAMDKDQTWCAYSSKPKIDNASLWSPKTTSNYCILPIMFIGPEPYEANWKMARFYFTGQKWEHHPA